jgi:ElaB/YqjD/DUF883 family membrane-anchored ribosome-binding protein
MSMLVGQEAPMTDQNFERGESYDWAEHETSNKKMRDAASEAFDKAADTARDAGKKAKYAAADAASTMTDRVMGILNEQLAGGADAVGVFASSMRHAADDLDEERPALASLVRGFAHTVDNYSDNLEGKTVEELTKTASDFTRRQPAIVFGMAAIAGFFAFRTYKNAQSVSSPPIQPSHHHPTDESHG